MLTVSTLHTPTDCRHKQYHSDCSVRLAVWQCDTQVLLSLSRTTLHGPSSRSLRPVVPQQPIIAATPAVPASTSPSAPLLLSSSLTPTSLPSPLLFPSR